MGAPSCRCSWNMNVSKKKELFSGQSKTLWARKMKKPVFFPMVIAIELAMASPGGHGGFHPRRHVVMVPWGLDENFWGRFGAFGADSTSDPLGKTCMLIGKNLESCHPFGWVRNLHEIYKPHLDEWVKYPWKFSEKSSESLGYPDDASWKLPLITTFTRIFQYRSRGDSPLFNPIQSQNPNHYGPHCQSIVAWITNGLTMG